jgi:hypothetical protein
MYLPKMDINVVTTWIDVYEVRYQEYDYSSRLSLLIYLDGDRV